MKNNRRDFLKITGITGLGLTGLGIMPAIATENHSLGETVQSAELQAYNRFPRMMQDYFLDRVSESLAKSRKRRASLKTKQDAEAYVKDKKQIPSFQNRPGNNTINMELLCNHK